MSAKRLIDVLVSALALLMAMPLLLPVMLAIWLEDRGSPLFFATRVGRGNRDFAMVKLRSMVVDALARGGTSTAATDRRITRMGHLIRRWKLDELPQFWNVLAGQMSLVGPRPNTRRGGVDAYTPAEMRLLTVLPGITDLASIVFADEGEILAGAADPDALYDRLIRPWKSRLALLYVERRSLAGDLRILALTALALVDRDRALLGVAYLVAEWGGSDALVRVCLRNGPLPLALPPGMRAAP
jgi:lipopolysaccharide/colanic/teichoic acid biosynthesis glycosyltransferase